MAALSRRRFLAAGVGAVALAACGDDGGVDAGESGGASSSTAGGAAPGAGTEFAVFTFFDPSTLQAGSEIRAPIGIGDQQGPLAIGDSPAEIDVEVRDEAGEVVATEIVAYRSDGLPRGYYPLRFTPPFPGLYDLTVRADGIGPIETTTQVFDEVVIPGPGDPFPVLDTPTFDDARGVRPICTRDPACDLHDVNLPDLLGDGSPSVVMISTPAFCSTAVCGPVLDLLLDLRADHPAVSMLHAEVYADPETDLSSLAPIVGAMSLTYEPSAVFVDADGVITERLDFVFDRSELAAALGRL